MFKKLKTLIIGSAAVLTLLVPALAMPVVVHADASINDSLCQGANLKATPGTAASCPSTDDSVTKINDIIAKIINIFSFVVGVIAVIMIIIGGIRFVLSGGDSANVSSARNTIIYAIVGLVIVALAQIIVKFVINKTAT